MYIYICFILSTFIYYTVHRRGYWRLWNPAFSWCQRSLPHTLWVLPPGFQWHRDLGVGTVALHICCGQPMAQELLSQGWTMPGERPESCYIRCKKKKGEIRRFYSKKLGTEERMSKDSLDSNLGRKVGKYIDRYTDVLPLHAFPLKKWLGNQQVILTSTEFHFRKDPGVSCRFNDAERPTLGQLCSVLRYFDPKTSQASERARHKLS